MNIIKMSGILLVICFLLVCCFLISGCNKGFKKMAIGKYVPVEGTVLMNGEPLEGVTVWFLPIEVGPDTPEDESKVVTDASGKFVLKTGSKNGCPEGAYRVSFSKFVDGEELLVNYVMPLQSGLTADVKESMEPLVFDLK